MEFYFGRIFFRNQETPASVVDKTECADLFSCSLVGSAAWTASAALFKPFWIELPAVAAAVRTSWTDGTVD